MKKKKELHLWNKRPKMICDTFLKSICFCDTFIKSIIYNAAQKIFS